jgi:hypothetical protein
LFIISHTGFSQDCAKNKVELTPALSASKEGEILQIDQILLLKDLLTNSYSLHGFGGQEIIDEANRTSELTFWPFVN